MDTPGFGPTQRQLLELLKRRGTATLRELALATALSRETLREHLHALAAAGLVARAGSRRGGRGRPEILYRLADSADDLFPQRDGAVLADLAAWLRAEGQEGTMKRFFEQRAERRAVAALERLGSLKGRRRLEEVARILTEEGYMAEVHGRSLRLCHCPLRQAVAATRAPCRAEQSFVERLLGRALERTDYLPEGGASCTYRPEDERRRRA